MITMVKKVYYDGRHVGYDMTKDDETSSVPLDEANKDYQAIQQWISEGNTVIDNRE